MAKKNFDYKVTINFTTSSHNTREYQTTDMIKKSVLMMLEHYFRETKKPGCMKIERNYSLAKWRKDRSKLRGSKKNKS